MMEEFTVSGMWWIPGHEKKKVAGVLKFTANEGARLETIGDDFSETVGPSSISNGLFTPLVCGYAVNGHDITLLDCEEVGHTFGGVKYGGSEWSSNTIIDGYSFDALNNVLFDGMSLEFAHLKEWLGFTGIKTKTRAHKSGQPSLEVTADPPEPIEFNLNDAWFRFQSDVACQMSVISGIRLEDRPKISIFPLEPLAFSSLSTIFVDPLKHFLSFGVGVGVSTTLQTVHSSNAIPDDSGESTRPYANVFAASGQAYSSKREVFSHEMLFTYRDVKDILPQALKNWFELEHRFAHGITSFFDAFYSRKALVLHDYFLVLSRFLEAYYHFKEPHSKDRSFAIAIEGVLTDFLAAQPSLVSRVVSDQAQFIKSVKETRNYLTHHSIKKSEHPVLDPNDLYRLIQKVKLLVIMCLLNELGLSSADIQNLLLRNHLYSYWLD
jgi:hypothetical protein